MRNGEGIAAAAIQGDGSQLLVVGCGGGINGEWCKKIAMKVWLKGKMELGGDLVCWVKRCGEADGVNRWE